MPLDLNLRLAHPEHRFPCPLCGKGLDVRQTKKKKPYVICDPCGVQLFVRSKAGTHCFEQLVSDAEQRNIWKRLDDLQSRYQRRCPVCKKDFWIAPDQIKTSWVDGTFEGYRCPERGCSGVVSWTKEKK
jgi:ssDNA-binding Zn-finger/Zn-ribbon topoisomerase 1